MLGIVSYFDTNRSVQPPPSNGQIIDQVSCVPHYDPGLFSISILSTHEGLQLKDMTNNEEIDGPLESNIGVIWLGEAASRITGNRLKPDKYEYMNEDAIDDKLKCIICAQPFQIPVILDCQHTFCEVCIDTWIKKNASCPICRRQVDTNYVLTKITDLDICNQLDCLPVRCLQCQKNGIQRNRFKKHIKRCAKSRITIFSDSIQNRFNSIKRTIRTKYNSLETLTPQRRVTPIDEPIQQQVTYHPPIQNNEQQIYNSRLIPPTVRPSPNFFYAEQSEEFICSSIPNLRIFDFQYHYSGTMENFIRACYSGRFG
ncbi:unnamed protein product [Adineta steineri]|uniref:RING-type domain-containing protein n=1 Tax=Adineta steineri TaxID=433720 RepID=A0A814M731_9BILA|nr:unnamed protein product [Adineta steineri]